MKYYFYAVVVIILLLISAVAVVVVPGSLANSSKDSSLYIGVSFNGNTTSEAKLLIDRIQPYTNLFVLQSWPISRNQTAAYEVCDYAVSKNLNIIVNLGTRQMGMNGSRDWAWQLELYHNASTRWGDRFLGIYYDDEPGGAQMDYDWISWLDDKTRFPVPENASSRWFYEIFAKYLDLKVNGTKPKDYNVEAQVFLDYFKLNQTSFQELKRMNLKLFISDYTLYWYDYLGGYDTVFTQIGANNSVPLAISQVRGAARLHDKDWGAIITWKYKQPPYLDTGSAIFEQMVTAYEAGAKYIVLFDYPQMEDNPYGVLLDEHFEALEEFSKHVSKNSNMRVLGKESEADAVLVLPYNYGFGMRRADDRIWGYWGTDDKTAQVWDTSQKLIAQYSARLDIVYDDPAFPVAGEYEHVYYWNQTL